MRVIFAAVQLLALQHSNGIHEGVTILFHDAFRHLHCIGKLHALEQQPWPMLRVHDAQRARVLLRDLCDARFALRARHRLERVCVALGRRRARS